MKSPTGTGSGRLSLERDQTAARAPFPLRFGWGLKGALALADTSDVVVVVDVLSFSTTVAVAAERGCRIIPHPMDPEAAAELARRTGAQLAVPRSEVDELHPFSLSPATLHQARRGQTVVLCSPNGATISAAAAARGALVAAGSLRNAAAVARFARSNGRRIAVIAAGERFSDGSLDPALEDLVGAGAVIDGLRRRRRSPEASLAASAFLSARRRGLLAVLRESVSGIEFSDRGLADELPWAAALNLSDSVPLYRDGAFVPVSSHWRPEPGAPS